MIKTFCHFKKIFFLSLRPITILAYHRWETEAQRAVAGLRSCSLLKAALRSIYFKEIHFIRTTDLDSKEEAQTQKLGGHFTSEGNFHLHKAGWNMKGRLET